MRVAWNDSDDRAGLRGYVQFISYTYIHTYYIHHHLPLGVSRNPAAEDNRCSCSSSLPGGL